MKMSRKEMIKEIEAMLDSKELVSSPDLWSALELVGKIGKDIHHKTDRHGLFLTKDEKKERGDDPMFIAEETDIEIHFGDFILCVGRADPDKPSYSLPVGQSDKVTTATVPRDWLLAAYIQALISAFDGDAGVAKTCAELVNISIDEATVIDEDTGRMRIDQKKLFSCANSVTIADIMETHKRRFVTSAKGTPTMNFGMSLKKADDREVHPIPDAVINPEEVLSTAFISPITNTNESTETTADHEVTTNDTMAEHPNSRQAVSAPDMTTEISPDIGAEDEEVGVEVSVAPTPDPDEIKDLFLSVMSLMPQKPMLSREIGEVMDEVAKDPANSIPGAFTIGIPETFGISSKKSDKARKKILDGLVKQGVVVKTGVKRGTRYALPEGTKCLHTTIRDGPPQPETEKPAEEAPEVIEAVEEAPEAPETAEDGESDVHNWLDQFGGGV